MEIFVKNQQSQSLEENTCSSSINEPQLVNEAHSLARQNFEKIYQFKLTFLDLLNFYFIILKT